MEEFCLKQYLSNNVRIIRWLGMWPKKDYVSEKLYVIYAIIVNVFFNLATNIGLTVREVMSVNDLQELTSGGYFILGLMGSVKTIFLIKYYKMFQNLLTAEIFRSTNIRLNACQHNILHKRMGFWKKIQNTYIYMSLAISVVFVIGPIFGENSYALPLKCWYPFDYKRPLIYYSVYFHQTVSSWINIFNNLCGATLTSSFLAYTAAECEVLVDMLRNLNGNEDLNMESGLIVCVKYHREIVKFSRNVESYFSKYLLLQFITSCVATALMMTNLSLSTEVNGDFFFVVALQVGAWADLFIYCWYGSEVTVKSTLIPYAAFESNWVDASRTLKNEMLFFIHRTQTPIIIYAVNFFVLSINTFTSILRTAVSYYTLLRQLSKDE